MAVRRFLMDDEKVEPKNWGGEGVVRYIKNL